MNPLKLMLAAAAQAEQDDPAAALTILREIARIRDGESRKQPEGRRDRVIRAGEEADIRIDRIQKRRLRAQKQESAEASARLFVEQHAMPDVDAEVKRLLELGNASRGDREEQRRALRRAVLLRRVELERASDDPVRMAQLAVALRYAGKFPESSVWFDRALSRLEGREPRYGGEPSDARACLQPDVGSAAAVPLERYEWIYTAQAALWAAVGVNDPQRPSGTIESTWWQAAERQYDWLTSELGESPHVRAGQAALVLNYIEKAYKPSFAERARKLITPLQGAPYWNLRGRFNSLASARGYEPLP